MQVILLRDVDNVGLRGDVVDVAAGYARNFLLPRRLAESATPGRLAEVHRREEQRARQEARTHDQAQEIATTLQQTELRFEVNAGPTGALFGSVTPTDITDEIWRVRRIRVDRRKIHLPEPIKRIGRYEVPIDLFEDVRAEVKTLVVPEGGELPPEEELAAAAAAVEAEAEAEAAAAQSSAEAVEALVVEEAEPQPAPDTEAELQSAPDAEAEPQPAPAAEAEPQPAPAAEAESEGLGERAE